MDKFKGINRAEIIKIHYEYEILPTHKFVINNNNKNQNKKRSRRIFFTALRYSVCGILIAICLIGKFTHFQPIKDAFNFIKDELKKDYVSEILSDED